MAIPESLRRHLGGSKNGESNHDQYAADQRGDAYEGELDTNVDFQGRPRPPELPEEPPPEPWEPPIPLTDAPAAQAFPVEVLPSALRQFVIEAAGAVACPEDYIAVPLLTLAGAAIGASRTIQIKHAWSERACLYSAVIGPPGSVKSPALKLVAAPFYHEQSRRMADYRRRLIAWEEDEKKGPKPTASTVYVNDVTCEALAVILQDNPRGVALIRDELTAWITAMDQYKTKGRGSDRQFYLAAWGGEPVAVHRKVQDAGPIYVSHPFVSVCGCLPPDLMNWLRGDRPVADGFLDRLLFSYPEPTSAVGESWLSVSEEACAAWAQTVSFLFALEMDSDNEGEKRPKLIRLNSTGRESWKRFTMELAEEMNEPLFADFLKGPWSKMKGYCARFALILHYLYLAAADADCEEIGGATIDRAATLVRYFQSHARRAHAALDSDPEVKEAQLILRWIEREERKDFKRWELHKDIRSQSRFPRIEDLDAPLNRLVKHNYIRAKSAKDPQRRGRKADPGFEVNPFLHHWENRVNRVNDHESNT